MSEEDKVEEIYSLILPTLTDSVVLPNVTVAEIVPFIDVNHAAEGQESWYLGELNWRGSHIPMVSLEIINGEEEHVSPTRRSRVAVVHSLNGDRDLPYLALLVQGIPRLAHIMRGEIHPLEGDFGPGSKMKVRLASQQLVIPDLDYIETLVKSIERKFIER